MSRRFPRHFQPFFESVGNEAIAHFLCLFRRIFLRLYLPDRFACCRRQSGMGTFRAALCKFIIPKNPTPSLVAEIPIASFFSNLHNRGEWDKSLLRPWWEHGATPPGFQWSAGAVSVPPRYCSAASSGTRHRDRKIRRLQRSDLRSILTRRHSNFEIPIPIASFLCVCVCVYLLSFHLNFPFSTCLIV